MTDNSEEKKTDSISLSMFREVNPEIHKTGLHFGAGIVTTEIVGRYMLLSDLRDSLLLHIVDLKTNKDFGACIRRGRSQGQCLNIASILPTGGEKYVWVYDITIGKLLKVDLDSGISKNNRNYLPSEEFYLDKYCKNLKSPCYVNDSIFAAYSYVHNDLRYFYFSRHSGLLRKVGKLPVASDDWPQDTAKGPFSFRASIYSGALKKNPVKPEFIALYSIFPRLEIYRNDTLDKILRGPEAFVPDLKFKIEEDKVFYRETRESKKAYLNAKASEHYIYLLYSGKSRDVDYSNTILVLDWNGTPQQIVRLNCNVSNFSVEETGNDKALLYYLDKQSGDLNYSELQFPDNHSKKIL